MNTLINHEVDTGSRTQTIAGLFQDEVTDMRPEARQSTLNVLQSTMRVAEAPSLPALFLVTDAAQQANSAVKPLREFDVIRM